MTFIHRFHIRYLCISTRHALGFLFKRWQIENELDEELRFHIERQIEDKVKAGMTREEARRTVLRSFGGVDQIKEACRDATGFRFMEDLWQDLKYGLRMLYKNPGFTCASVLTLALGIGANTAIFSLINSVLIRSLPVPHPEQLVVLKAHHEAEPRYISYPMYLDLAERQQVFSGVLATCGQGRRRITLAGSGRRLEQVRTARVSMNYFAVLGVDASVGRTFSAVRSSVPEAVISYGFWEQQFGRDVAAVGQGLLMTIGIPPDHVERVFTIVGVAPPEFFGDTVGDAPEVWVPMEHYFSGTTLGNSKGSFFQVLARRKPEVSEPEALAATNVLYQQLLAEEIARGGPSVVLPYHRASGYRVAFESGSGGLDRLRKQYSRPLQLLLATSGVVLLIACSNLANLLLARGSARSREIAMRLALGARRRRLVRQLLTESLLLSFAGGVLGLFTASFGSTLLVAIIESRSGLLILDSSPDARVLGFSIALSTLTGLIFGLVPALRTASVDVGLALKSASRSQTAGPHTQRFGKVLVAAQVALSLTLVSGAGLLLRSLQKLQALNTGFDKENILLVKAEIHHVPRAEWKLLCRQIEQGANAIPGVRSASLSLVSLFNPGDLTGSVSVEGYEPPPRPRPVVRYNVVSSRYFDTVGMKLAAGRDFTDRDTPGAPRVAIVNESFASQFFGNENPLGRRILNRDKFDPGSAFEIVGVVRDSKYNDLRQEPTSMFYLPIYQTDRDFTSIEVRTHSKPEAVAGSVRHLIERAHPGIEIGEFTTIDEQIGRSLTHERLLSKLTMAFGLMALLLACVGLYGVLSFAVARRTQEIGIRIALGAQRTEVRRFFMKEALLLTAIGLLAGVPLVLVSGRLVESFLFGLAPTDPATLAGASVLLLAVGLAAAYLPARRASRVDPMIALRYE